MTATFSTWLGPRPGAWVARRMAHETAIHRWDAAGGAFDAALAIDGIDELLDELAPLDHLTDRLDGTTSTVHLHSTDSDDGEWLVQIGRAACRARGWQYGTTSVVAGSCHTITLTMP